MDVGTTAVKALAVDEDGRVLARARVPHEVIVPAPGRLEHDPVAAWVRGPQRAVAALGVSPVAVAVAALVPALSAVDADGFPAERGILYDDERGRPLGPYRGGDPTASPEASEMLRWMAAAHPAAAGYWPAQAVAIRALGGPGVVDFATAMSMGPLYSLDGWDEVACAAAGATARQLPAVAGLGEPVGAVTEGPASGAVLATGSVDAFCEQLVAGPVDDGDALVVLGSTLVVWSARATPAEAPGVLNGPRLDGRWFVGGASNAGGLWLDWAERALASGDPALAAPQRVPVWWPHVRGERAPGHDPSRRGELRDVDLTQGPAELRRAALEASAFVVRSLLERSGPLPARIVATGGGVSSRPWLQAIADVTGAVVEPVAVPEGAALAAAYLARLASGLEVDIEGASRWAAYGPVVTPQPAWVAATARRYERFIAFGGPG